MSEVKDKAFREAMKKAPDALFREWKGAFKTILVRFNARFQRRRLRGRPGLFTRSGRLRDSFKWVVTGHDFKTLVGTYFTDVLYAKVHQHGAVITPKRARFLTIPIGPALTQGGGAKSAKVARGRAHDFPGLHFMMGKKGPFLGKPGRDHPIAYFLLRKQVKIPPRLGIKVEWKDFRTAVKDELRAATQRALTAST